MAARSIASLTLGFGLVSIPVKLYAATESSATVRFNLLAPDGGRVRQQYVAEKDGKVVPRARMVKGYEFEKDKFVLFEADELKALEGAGSHAVDIVAFIPATAIDPVYYDKAYLLAPDKRGDKTYALLLAAMRKSGRCALARWTWKTKQYVVQVRAAEGGMVLQQLFYADEVRRPEDLGIAQVDVKPAELQLALQLIDQVSEDDYDPTQYVNEEKQRVLAAIDRKITGREVVASAHDEAPRSGAQVIDLMAALRASLAGKGAPAKSTKRAATAPPARQPARKGAKRSSGRNTESKDRASAQTRERA